MTNQQTIRKRQHLDPQMVYCFAHWLAVVCLVVAVTNPPPLFYYFLRWIVFVLAFWSFSFIHKQRPEPDPEGTSVLPVLLLMLVVVFNPIFRFHGWQAVTWHVWDLIAALALQRAYYEWLSDPHGGGTPVIPGASLE